MKRFLRCMTKYFCIFCLLLSVPGCAGIVKRPEAGKTVVESPESPVDPFHAFPGQFRVRAMEYEKKGEILKALQSWEIVRSFDPGDEQAENRIDELKAQAHREAEGHYEKGLSYFRNNAIRDARREFLLALSRNPDHSEAVDYLKNKLTGEEYTVYEVAEGDTLKGIAAKVLSDSGKDFLIAYFNDLDKDSSLTPGMSIQIPVLVSIQPEIKTVVPKEEPQKEIEVIYETEEPQKEIEVMYEREEPDKTSSSEERLRTAKVFFNEKKYQDVLSIAGEVLENEPANNDARDLMHESYYQMGLNLKSKNKYRRALAMFERVDPDFKDVEKNKAFLKESLAEEHYKKGIKYFINEELSKAIQEWETTMSLNPNHPNAAKDIENASVLLEKLKEVE